MRLLIVGAAGYGLRSYLHSAGYLNYDSSATVL